MLTTAQHETGLGIGAREKDYGVFIPARFEYTAAMVLHKAAEKGRILDADELACIMFLADMDAFAMHGEPITCASWVRGPKVPWCREMGEHWLHGFVLSIAYPEHAGAAA
jgi:hypothetical protein